MLDPLGMRHTVADRNKPVIEGRARFYEMGDDKQVVHATCIDVSYKWPGGGMLATAEDVVRLGSAFLKPGFLKPETLTLVFTPLRLASGEESPRHEGLGWRIVTREDGGRVFQHSGDGYAEDGVVLRTTEQEVLDDGTVRFVTIAPVRQASLPFVDRLFHTVASPAITYLLLLVGLTLIVFEFFTAGVGIAGGSGRALVLACTGLATLPASGWAVGLIIASMFAFAVDVQVGVPRFWTVVGLVGTVIGSFWLFEPLPGATLRPPWITLLAGIGWHGDRLRGRHAIDGPNALRHPDDRPRRLAARGARRGRRTGQPRRRRQGRRGDMAGADEPGDAGACRLPGARRRHRRRDARGGTPGRCRP